MAGFFDGYNRLWLANSPLVASRLWNELRSEVSMVSFCRLYTKYNLFFHLGFGHSSETICSIIHSANFGVVVVIFLFV